MQKKKKYAHSDGRYDLHFKVCPAQYKYVPYSTIEINFISLHIG